jgi:hypothetical protein
MSKGTDMATLVDFMLGLYRSPEAAQAFIAAPAEALSDAGFPNVTPAQLQAVAASAIPPDLALGEGDLLSHLQKSVADHHGISLDDVFSKAPGTDSTGTEGAEPNAPTAPEGEGFGWEYLNLNEKVSPGTEGAKPDEATAPEGAEGFGWKYLELGKEGSAGTEGAKPDEAASQGAGGFGWDYLNLGGAGSGGTEGAKASDDAISLDDIFTKKPAEAQPDDGTFYGRYVEGMPAGSAGPDAGDGSFYGRYVEGMPAGSAGPDAGDSTFYGRYVEGAQPSGSDWRETAEGAEGRYSVGYDPIILDKPSGPADQSGLDWRETAEGAEGRYSVGYDPIVPDTSPGSTETGGIAEVDDVPEATLLLPYYETDLDTPESTESAYPPDGGY